MTAPGTSTFGSNDSATGLATATTTRPGRPGFRLVRPGHVLRPRARGGRLQRHRTGRHRGRGGTTVAVRRVVLGRHPARPVPVARRHIGRWRPARARGSALSVPENAIEAPAVARHDAGITCSCRGTGAAPARTPLTRSTWAARATSPGLSSTLTVGTWRSTAARRSLPPTRRSGPEANPCPSAIWATTIRTPTTAAAAPYDPAAGRDCED